MDLLERLLGLGENRGRGKKQGLGDDISETVGNISRWILGCGCLLIAGVILLGVLLVAGVINFGDQAVLVIIVFATIIVAIASLIRTGLAGG
ncbi:MAG TPA: hypothetical protein VHP83_18295 [Aggregatilineaceae bacterium]|nr:hypothetical protein [Aggregatilineaceae bacterium]